MFDSGIITIKGEHTANRKRKKKRQRSNSAECYSTTASSSEGISE